MKPMAYRIALLELLLFIFCLPVRAQTPTTLNVSIRAEQGSSQKFEFQITRLLVNKIWIQYLHNRYTFDFSTPRQTGTQIIGALGDSVRLRSDVRNFLDTEFINVLRKDGIDSKLMPDSLKCVFTLAINAGDSASFPIRINRDTHGFEMHFLARQIPIDTLRLKKLDTTYIFLGLDSLEVCDTVTNWIISEIFKLLASPGIQVDVFFPSGKAANESMNFELLRRNEILSSCSIPSSIQFPGPKDTTLVIPVTSIIDMNNMNDIKFVITANAPLSHSVKDIAISIDAQVDSREVRILPRRIADIQDDSIGVLTWDLKPASEDTTFTFSIGTNFNFLSSLKLSGLYFEFNATVPDLIYGNLGIEAGLYQGSSSAKNTGGDSTVYSTTSINGFYLNPILKYSENFYYGLNIEFRETQTSYDSIVKNGKTTFGATPIPNDEFLIGPYLVFQYQDGGVSFEVDLVPSMWNQLGNEWYKHVGSILRPFAYRGLYQFQIEELAHSIMLGGQVRAPSQGRPTQYMLYLTKEFRMSKLVDFINGIFH